ncbi:unnamed protein product [Lampetra planeri]
MPRTTTRRRRRRDFPRWTCGAVATVEAERRAGRRPPGCNDFSHLMPPLSPDSGAAGFGDGGQLRLPDDFDIAKLIAVGGL